MDVAPTPGLVEPGSLAARRVLVVDVLRASTSMVMAVASGCAGIVPVADPGEARRRAAEAEGRALIAGERGGERIAGFDLGNSPCEFRTASVHGRLIVFTTTNGTAAILAARAAAAVGVAALVNLGAAAAWAADHDGDVTIVCAGERGEPAVEDIVCAGLLVERLLGRAPGARLTPQAAEARAVAARYADDVGRLAADAPWARHLERAGHAEDVRACLALDTVPVVPVLLPGVDSLVEAPG